jgi:hypothetical protein
MRVVRDANASRFRDPFESGRDVNAIAEYVVVVENDVADMNADAEFDPHFLRNAGILSCHFALDLDRAAALHPPHWQIPPAHRRRSS